MSAGYDNRTTAAAPEATHESAAKQWANSKNRLHAALQASNAASAELQDAQQTEQSAWEILEREAGRGAPTPMKNPGPEHALEHSKANPKSTFWPASLSMAAPPEPLTRC